MPSHLPEHVRKYFSRATKVDYTQPLAIVATYTAGRNHVIIIITRTRAHLVAPCAARAARLPARSAAYGDDMGCEFLTSHLIFQ